MAAKKRTKKSAKRRAAGRGKTRHGLPGSRATLMELVRTPVAAYEAAPTLHSGHFDDLKFESPKYRVWVSRADLADYDGDRKLFDAERNVIETNVNGRWLRVDRRTGKIEPR